MRAPVINCFVQFCPENGVGTGRNKTVQIFWEKKHILPVGYLTCSVKYMQGASIFNQNKGVYSTISTYIYLYYLNLLCALINTYKYTNNHTYAYKLKFSNIYKKRLVFNHCLTVTLIAIGTLKRFMKNQLYIQGSH